MLLISLLLWFQLQLHSLIYSYVDVYSVCNWNQFCFMLQRGKHTALLGINRSIIEICMSGSTTNQNFLKFKSINSLHVKRFVKTNFENKNSHSKEFAAGWKYKPICRDSALPFEIVLNAQLCRWYLSLSQKILSLNQNFGGNLFKYSDFSPERVLTSHTRFINVNIWFSACHMYNVYNYIVWMELMVKHVPISVFNGKNASQHSNRSSFQKQSFIISLHVDRNCSKNPIENE